MAQPLDVLITGGTGYVGQRLIAELLACGHRVRALARRSSTSHVPAGASVVVGDALDAESVTAAMKPGDTVVHLGGHAASESSESERVSASRLAIYSCHCGRGSTCENSSSDIRERRATGSGHARLSRSTGRGRSHDPRSSTHGIDSTAVVHPWSGPLVAARAASDIQDHGTLALHTRERATARSGDPQADGSSLGCRGRKSARRRCDSNRRCAGHPACESSLVMHPQAVG
jgi:NAD(P)H-binding